MGIEEVIWDCGYWAQGMTAFSPYSVCFNRHGKRRSHVDRTAAHQNHVHFGMTRRGAAARTSSWAAR